MVCEKVKEVISLQTTAEEMMAWKNRMMAYFEERNISFPVFEEKQEKREFYPDVKDSP